MTAHQFQWRLNYVPSTSAVKSSQWKGVSEEVAGQEIGAHLYSQIRSLEFRVNPDWEDTPAEVWQYRDNSGWHDLTEDHNWPTCNSIWGIRRKPERTPEEILAKLRAHGDTKEHYSTSGWHREFEKILNGDF
jgi:hypothetical protein